MGSLYIGASGLQTSQNALNTTAHNMSNIDTTGYTRQQIALSSKIYNTISTSGSAVAYQQTGLGVTFAQTKQVRDYFLDKTYRRESGRSAFYETSAATLEEVEDILQELDGDSFASTLENLWNSVEDLATEPDSSVKQGTLVQRCYEFITTAQKVYESLSNYQDNLNGKVQTQVNSINSIGNKILNLNQQIVSVESGDIEKANDLKDQRNALLDELSGYANISYDEDITGNVLVKIEGVDFVTADSVNKMALETDTTTGFYTPYWYNMAKKTTNADGSITVDTAGARVFNPTETISTETNTDIGSLKSLLLSRGEKRSTYEDIADPTYYDTNVSQSIMMNIQAEFDQLVNKVTTKINEVLKTAADAATAKDPASTYLRDSNGNAYQIYETVSGGTNFTVENLMVNSDLRQAPSLLGFVKPEDSTDFDIGAELKKVFSEAEHTLNPNVATKTNLIDYYDSLVSQVANTGSVLDKICETQQLTVDNAAAAREQIIGVSSDEELSSMVMYQNAYNAASRYINVISEMLEHIINTLAR